MARALKTQLWQSRPVGRQDAAHGFQRPLAIPGGRAPSPVAELPFSGTRKRPLYSIGTTNAGAGHDPASAQSSWQVVILAEIADFAVLRRELGRAPADRLVFAVMARAATTVVEAAVEPVGRSLVEIRAGADCREAGEAVVNKLAAAFQSSFDLDGAVVNSRIVLAAALCPSDDFDEIRLIEEAESALEQARLELRPVIRDLSAGTPAFDRVTLSWELSAAIANEEMFLQYQPKLNVRRREICSIEALVRWQHPARGLIMPSDFITFAEEAHQIGPLTLWTLRRVVADQHVLMADGFDMPVFINISGQLLSDAAFVDEACEIVRGGSVKIGFEVTETAVIRDPASAIANLQRFADTGITIAIDDYGAGLSSLAYLKQLPARELKIDKLFIMQLTSSNRDPLIVRSTIDLAHALEMEVTAEGVETQAALALLTVMGCDVVQGYLISRPLGIDDLRGYLRDDKRHLAEDQRDAMFKRPASFWRSS